MNENSRRPNGTCVSNSVGSRGEREVPWMEYRDVSAADSIGLLDREIIAFSDWVRPTRAEHEYRQGNLAVFEQVVQQLWPGAACELFGSSATGLFLPNGDFDVVISHRRFADYPTVQLLEILKRRLHTVELAEPSSMRVLSNPRVPLVKFCTTEAFGSFSFDVSLNDAFDECGAPNSNGSAGARVSLRLMRDLEEGGDLERLKRLVMFFKVFLDCHGWNSARDGGLGGMSVFCLVVSFLQLDDRPPSQQSAAQDLLAFLHYYGSTFDCARDAISVAEGGSLFDRRTLLTPRRESFPDGQAKLISVLHPALPDNDLTANSSRWPQIREKLEIVYEHLYTFSRSPPTPPFPSSTNSDYFPLLRYSIVENATNSWLGSRFSPLKRSAATLKLLQTASLLLFAEFLHPSHLVRFSTSGRMVKLAAGEAVETASTFTFPRSLPFLHTIRLHLSPSPAALEAQQFDARERVEGGGVAQTTKSR